jgi:hypothetical protein
LPIEKNSIYPLRKQQKTGPFSAAACYKLIGLISAPGSLKQSLEKRYQLIRNITSSQYGLQGLAQSWHHP